MTLPDNKLQEIEQVFLREIDGARLLLKALEIEHDALAKHHTESLEVAVREKQERIHQLELISKKREALLAPLISTSGDANENKLYQFDGNRQLISLWHQLVDIAEKCRETNRINGSIVELASRQTREALDILQGILPEHSTSELYDRVGNTTKTINKRELLQV